MTLNVGAMANELAEYQAACVFTSTYRLLAFLPELDFRAVLLLLDFEVDFFEVTFLAVAFFTVVFFAAGFFF